MPRCGCAEYFTGYAEASWFFWRAGDKAWSQLLDKRSLCAPLSIFDDWSRIVKDTKDDLNTEIMLHLNLGAATLRDLDIDAFKSGKRLGTADLELEVRPSAIQFRPDD